MVQHAKFADRVEAGCWKRKGISGSLNDRDPRRVALLRCLVNQGGNRLNATNEHFRQSVV